MPPLEIPTPEKTPPKSSSAQASRRSLLRGGLGGAGAAAVTVPLLAPSSAAANATSNAGSDTTNVVWVSAPSGDATGATDLAAINAAISALPDTGGIVQLQTGTYIVPAPADTDDGSVSMTVDNSVLAGVGMDVTRIQLAAGSHGGATTGIVRTPSGVANSNITFRDFTIDGNNTNQTIPAPKTGFPLVIGFYCGTTPDSTSTDTDITLLNIKVVDTSGYGLDPHNRTTRLKIIGCRAENVGLSGVHDGFTLDGNYDAQVIGCTVVSPGRHGFNLVTASSGTLIANCHSIGAGGNGITVQNGSKNCTIADNVIESSALDGIRVVGTEQTGAEEDLLPGWNNAIKGNHISSPGGHGIHLIAVPDATVTGNTIRDANQADDGSNGILLDEGTSGTPLYTTGCTVIGNDVGVTSSAAHTMKYGIAETSSGESNWVVGNHVAGAATASLSLLGGTTLAYAAHNGTAGAHPASFAYSWDSPASRGLSEYNYPPTLIGDSSTPIASGVVYFIAVTPQNSFTVGHLALYIGVVGAHLTSGDSRVGLYTISDGVATLKATSADQSTAWSTASATDALTWAAITGVAVTANQPVLVGVLSVGTTPPGFGRAPAATGSPANAGMAKSAPLLFATHGTAGQTALPASFTLDSASFTAADRVPLWAGLAV